jgi:hypothetical protein
MLDFMSLAANLIDRNFEKATIVTGMCLMPEKHNAENIKLAFEKIINTFEFDKSIINGKRILYCYTFKKIISILLKLVRLTKVVHMFVFSNRKKYQKLLIQISNQMKKLIIKTQIQMKYL